MQMRGPEVVVTGTGNRHLKNSQRSLRVTHLLIFRLPIVIVIRIKMKQSPRKRNTSALTEYTYKDTKAGESDHICYSEHLVIQKSNNNVPFLDYKETKA